jgi:hypothetical protein
MGAEDVMMLAAISFMTLDYADHEAGVVGKCPWCAAGISI